MANPANSANAANVNNADNSANAGTTSAGPSSPPNGRSSNARSPNARSSNARSTNSRSAANSPMNALEEKFAGLQIDHDNNSSLIEGLVSSQKSINDLVKTILANQESIQSLVHNAEVVRKKDEETKLKNDLSSFKKLQVTKEHPFITFHSYWSEFKRVVIEQGLDEFIDLVESDDTITRMSDEDERRVIDMIHETVDPIYHSTVARGNPVYEDAQFSAANIMITIRKAITPNKPSPAEFLGMFANLKIGSSPNDISIFFSKVHNLALYIKNNRINVTEPTIINIIYGNLGDPFTGFLERTNNTIDDDVGEHFGTLIKLENVLIAEARKFKYKNLSYLDEKKGESKKNKNKNKKVKSNSESNSNSKDNSKTRDDKDKSNKGSKTQTNNKKESSTKKLVNNLKVSLLDVKQIDNGDSFTSLDRLPLRNRGLGC